ncbi:MAG: VanZ family protein [Paucibacter sp.]|nr:VanZ family protein [Roseateles sp.]
MRQRSSSWWLLMGWIGLILYASLYPFEPWRWPPGLELLDLFMLPWPRRLFGYDVLINVVGYAPLGLLLFAVHLRHGGRLRGALALSVLVPPLVSYSMEVLQTFLPGRVPSLSDWLFNSLGALAGVVIGLGLRAAGGLRRWEDIRADWFAPRTSAAQVLLLVWPVGLLFPTPLALGVGQWLPRLESMAYDALDGTPWALADPLDDPPVMPLPPGLEALGTALGLLAPVLLALAIARPGWRRLPLIAGTLLLGMLGMSVATGLSVGPQHAFAWMTLQAKAGLGLGLVLSLLCVPLAGRTAAALGLIVLCALIALVTQAPNDPYLLASLQTLQFGRYINLYGMAQWIGWVWPFATLAWLLGRVAAAGGRDPG